MLFCGDADFDLPGHGHAEVMGCAALGAAGDTPAPTPLPCQCLGIPWPRADKASVLIWTSLPESVPPWIFSCTSSWGADSLSQGHYRAERLGVVPWAKQSLATRISCCPGPCLPRLQNTLGCTGTARALKRRVRALSGASHAQSQVNLRAAAIWGPYLNPHSLNGWH